MMHRSAKEALSTHNESLILRIRKRPFYYLTELFLIVNVTIVIINIGVWFLAAKQGLFIAADFTSLYTGGKMVLNGDGSRLYDLQLQVQYQKQILGDITFKGGLLPYVTPPFVAVIFSPLALLPITTAFYVWTLGEAGLLVWLIFLLKCLFSNWTRYELLLLVVSILAYWPLMDTFLLGQFSLLFLIAITQVYISIYQSRLVTAGTWLTLLFVKPQALPIPGAMSLNKPFWRIAASAVVTGAVLILFSGIFVGYSTWLNYIRLFPMLSSYFGSFGFLPSVQYTLRGMLTNLLGYTQSSLINLVSIIFFVAGIVLVWVLWLRGIPAHTPHFKLYFAFTVLLSALLSLHANPHDDLILVLPASLFYDYLRENGFPRKAYSILVLLSPLVFFIAVFTKFNLFGFIRPPLVVIFILLIWMAYYLVRSLQEAMKNQPSGAQSHP